MAKRPWILALVVFVPAAIFCFLASASHAFHSPPALPPEHPKVQEATQRSDFFFVLFLLSTGIAALAALMLYRALRAEKTAPVSN